MAVGRFRAAAQADLRRDRGRRRRRRDARDHDSVASRRMGGPVDRGPGPGTHQRRTVHAHPRALRSAPDPSDPAHRARLRRGAPHGRSVGSPDRALDHSAGVVRGPRGRLVVGRVVRHGRYQGIDPGRRARDRRRGARVLQLVAHRSSLSGADATARRRRRRRATARAHHRLQGRRRRGARRLP